MERYNKDSDYISNDIKQLYNCSSKTTYNNTSIDSGYSNNNYNELTHSRYNTNKKLINRSYINNNKKNIRSSNNKSCTNYNNYNNEINKIKVV